MKPTLTKEGRALLWKAVRAIESRPRTFDMEKWLEHDEAVPGKEPYCGTVACIAGHVAILGGIPPSAGCYLNGPLPPQFQEKLPSTADAERGRIPFELGDALAAACERSMNPGTSKGANSLTKDNPDSLTGDGR